MTETAPLMARIGSVNVNRLPDAPPMMLSIGAWAAVKNAIITARLAGLIAARVEHDGMVYEVEHGVGPVWIAFEGINPVRERETTPAPARWSHIDLPEGAVMIRRFDAQVGDVLVSSHHGKAKVIDVLRHSDNPDHVVELRFEGHGVRHENGTPQGFIRSRNERYDGSMMIPLIPSDD